MNQPEPKPFLISKHQVLEAWKRVKANQGAGGVDEESIKDFEQKLKDNLYRIWNRMSSGSYLPPAVRTVAIPKDGGGERNYRSMLHPVFRPLDRILVRWACQKYKKLRGHRRRATHWLKRISLRQPKMWAHWAVGVRVTVLT